MTDVDGGTGREGGFYVSWDEDVGCSVRWEVEWSKVGVGVDGRCSEWFGRGFLSGGGIPRGGRRVIFGSCFGFRLSGGR